MKQQTTPPEDAEDCVPGPKEKPPALLAEDCVIEGVVVDVTAGMLFGKENPDDEVVEQGEGELELEKERKEENREGHNRETRERERKKLNS